MLRNLFGLLWLLVGGMLAMTGVLYRIPGGLRDPAHPFVNLLNDLANIALQLPVDIKTQLLVDSHGLLPVFGGAGGVFALIGFYLLLTRSAAKPQTAAPPPTIKITKKHAKGAVARDKPQAVASASATDEAESLFDNAERLVALSHGNFSAVMALQVIRHYHQNVVPFLDCFSDDAKASYARQTVSHAILVLKRTERGIAVDQFKGHDEKIIRRLPQLLQGIR